MPKSRNSTSTRNARTSVGNVSIVSIDPIVAQHIKAMSRTTEDKRVRPSREDKDASRGSPSKKQTGLEKKDTARNGEQPSRSNSLRRVKNSTELLRKHSSKTHKTDEVVDSGSNSKGGRHFTVGNVGTGGLLYLRPSANQPYQPSPRRLPIQQMPPPSDVLTQHEGDSPVLNEYEVWSDSQRSGPVAPHLKRSITNGARRPRLPPSSAPRQRSRSFSAGDEGHTASSSDAHSGSFKIVIDRSAITRPTTAQSLSMPTLEVSIPHYRLGTPRFSTHGTPILRNSAYSRASATPSDVPPPKGSLKPGFLFPAPPTAYRQGSGSQERSRMMFHPSNMTSTDGESQADHSVIDETYATAETVSPALFDELAQVLDDPAVVRYSPRTGEIVAATPARIVAQISSDAFMDYDLVSDFFLTFRSYLTPSDLLDLLLARLRWAIGRLTEDGRIVRIRTFAALRHWILNYFMDDFVVNRSLRIRFCDEINNLYAEVAQRAGGGGSDAKILQDLKRCWNGRCSLYWDSPVFAPEIPLDAEIAPGGSMGSRVYSGHEFEMLQALQQQHKHSASNQSWFGSPPDEANTPRQEKHGQNGGTRNMDSFSSEQSLQPLSCSIPTTFLRKAQAITTQRAGPQPVLVPPKRQNAPSKLTVLTEPMSTRPRHSHKRSGSFSDSLRGKSPADVKYDYGSLSLPYVGSLIRGQLFPPATPLIEVLTPGPLLGHPSRLDVNRNAADGRDPGHEQNGVATKNIFGSLRRVLNNRSQSSHSPSASSLDHQPVPVLDGKTSALPLNVAKSNDSLKGRPAAKQMQSQLRIDLLCAAIAQTYEAVQAVMKSAERDDGRDEGIGRSDVNGHVAEHRNPGSAHLGVPSHQDRVPSVNTARSGSILIVDDTGLDLPAMSNPAPYDATGAAFVSDAATSRGDSTPRSAFFMPMQQDFAQQNAGLASKGHPLPSDRIGHRRTSTAAETRTDTTASVRFDSPDHARPIASTAGSSMTLRKRGSAMSDRRSHDPSVRTSKVRFSLTEDDSDHDSTRLPLQTLRRRPGGNLRKNQTVHDLEPLRSESLDSTKRGTDSADDSLVIMSNTPSPQKAPPVKTTISMINTHSSQQLRPSFEAAVAGFVEIPDDDDGGLEATLLKLEGRYDKASPPLKQEPFPAQARTGPAPAKLNGKDRAHGQTRAVASRSTAPKLTTRMTPVFGLPTESPTESEAGSDNSENAVPLLERRVSGSPASTAEPKEKPPDSLANGADKGNENGPEDSLHPSAEVDGEAVAQDVHSASTIPETANSSAMSFYLDGDDDDDNTDLSSEISVDIINHADSGPTYSSMFTAPGTAISGLELPSHPLAHSPAQSFLIHQMRPTSAVQKVQRQHMPPTPDPSPVHAQIHSSKNSGRGSIRFAESKAPLPTAAPIPNSPGHIPFILACTSELLAQQLTLVEKAALAEVDWKDLVEMRWNNRPAAVQDWVEYLLQDNHQGIDLVVTRFNLVVKWVMSEVVMTHNIFERARVIVKYIHVAAHCRKLHNYATMLQITIALTSIDCIRLQNTWEIVPTPDKHLLRNMETLVQPLRNFHDLRQEMESADLSHGCIPFVGLYVHDLTYNAQKPADVGSPDDGEPLVNFERYRTAATIVKGLLRLIDASTRYNFEMKPGVIDRCLWLAALSDDKIRAMSKSLETGV